MGLEKTLCWASSYNKKNVFCYIVTRLYSSTVKGGLLNPETNILNYLPADSFRETRYRSFPPTRRPVYKAIVFDKDGTLICFDSMWVPWAKQVATSISAAVKLDVQEDIFTVLGVCSKTSRIQPGLLAEGTKSQICEAITGILTRKNISRAHAHEISAHHINCCIPQPQHVNQLEDLRQLFTVLRQHDIRVAVCTSDSREPTIQALDNLGILHLVDLVICGDDKQTYPKPDPHNGLLICDKLSVKPNEVVMVGDTPTDVKFAKNSRFGLTLGVLSGVGRRSDLERAWYGSIKTELNVRQLEDSKFQIIPSVADIIPIVLPNSPVPVRVRPRFSTVSQYDSTKKYKLVILDKNGSLTDVHPRWSNWAEVINSRLRKITSTRIADKFMEMIGYDAESRRVSGGMLPDCSILHIRDCLGYLLNLNGYDQWCSSEIVNKVWFVPDSDADSLLPGVVETITHLRQHGVATALNTSDSREVSRNFLSCTGLEGKIDYVLSAEDAGKHPKPSPHTVYRVLNALGHQPDEAIVVGDTPSDLISGQAAGVGLTVGVLSGFSRAHNLLPYANWLIPNITYLPWLVLSNQH
ncbi:hypothetical protein CRM22_007285 [Opisthorchis felineus]|uniref:Uncharacterized protein n=1 Tax=Opisthorchis felineus TaxID=147828 RepID=A0A4S2LGJ1_OPIFE|nr:hypothetical protein CRM22_007285 [Opisthorchis felineus]